MKLLSLLSVLVVITLSFNSSECKEEQKQLRGGTQAGVIIEDRFLLTSEKDKSSIDSTSTSFSVTKKGNGDVECKEMKGGGRKRRRAAVGNGTMTCSCMFHMYDPGKGLPKSPVGVPIGFARVVCNGYANCDACCHDWSQAQQGK